MEIVVIGLGSMGKRRIRLIRELAPEAGIIGVDGRSDRREEAKALYHIPCEATIEAVSCMSRIDAAFVCTSPLSHASIIEECLIRGWNVFTELNLVADKYEENIALAKQNKVCLFLSSTFLYRDEIRYLRQQVEGDSGWNYVYHIGQYLPDWHPWENYKDFFVGDVRTNGCREIMAIELPWITRAFGEVSDYHVISTQMTDLQVACSDNYMIQLLHKNGSKGILVVDVVSPVPVRRLEVYKEHRYYRWEGTPESLCGFDSNKSALFSIPLSENAERREGYREFVVENAYRNEIVAFFESITAGTIPEYGFKEDREVLHLIDCIEGILC